MADAVHRDAQPVTPAHDCPDTVSTCRTPFVPWLLSGPRARCDDAGGVWVGHCLTSTAIRLAMAERDVQVGPMQRAVLVMQVSNQRARA